MIKKTMTNIYAIKIINLDRRQDRFEKMRKLLECHEIENYDRFSAIDGKKLELTDDLKFKFRNNKFNWRRGVMGACLSHYYLWKQLLESNYQYYLIFEDDIELCTNFKNKLNKVIEKIEKENYHFIFLGYTTDKEFIKRIYDHELDDVIIYSLKYKNHIWGGLFAYLIHKDFAKLLVNDIEKNGFTDPIDVIVLQYNDLYVTSPILVTTNYMTFNNNIDSDIHYDILSIYDNYEFYPLQDSVGYDITVYPGKTVYELKELCDKNPYYAGFNTYGFVKYKIRDTKEFIKLPGAVSKCQGLYVKKKFSQESIN